MTRRNDDTTLRDAAFLGGGALAAYLLLRGFGGFGLGGGGIGSRGDGGGDGLAREAPERARPFCNVFLRRGRYELEGEPSDFATAVAACRASGRAYIRASGDTRQAALDDLIRALLEGGVSWFGGSAALLDSVERVRTTMAARRS